MRYMSHAPVNHGEIRGQFWVSSAMASERIRYRRGEVQLHSLGRVGVGDSKCQAKKNIASVDTQVGITVISGFGEGDQPQFASAGRVS